MQRSIRTWIVATGTLAALFSIAAPASAMRPSGSRGEQFLSISETECEARARAAYANAGWTDIAGEATWVRGHKGDYESYTACNADAAGGVVVNIFVAYGASDPSGDLVGGERKRLQDEMERAPGSR